MSLVAISGLNFSFGGRELFKDLSLSIEKDSRIGLVGVNGCGKTTLFSLIKGRLTPESGDILKAGKCQMAFLRQENELNQTQSLLEEVLTSRPKMLEIEKQLHELNLQLEKESNETLLNKMTKLQQQFELMGGFTFETEMKLLLTSLNFPESEWYRSVSSFSGGEQSRIQLAKILLAPHDLLLLDEPTNHLDTFQIEFLKNFLNRNTTPYIIISHDRYFLDETVKNIVEIRGKKAKKYRGNYSAFVQQSEANHLLEEKLWKAQQKHIAKEEDFIRRNLAGQKTKQAQGRRKILERTERLDRPDSLETFNLGLNSEYRSSNDIFRMTDIKFGYPDKELAYAEALYAGYKDRIAIIGANGCGKSTLLKALLGYLAPLSGTLYVGNNLKIGYFGQMQEELNTSIKVMDTIWEMVPDAPQGYVLGYLARFGFRGDDVDKNVGTLSGGEKARLKLAVLIHQKPNLLILDEPTNHLDIYMVDSLEEALKAYDGTLVFVSHDRYFIDKVSTKKWFFSKGIIKESKDSFAKVIERIQLESQEKPVTPKQQKPKSNKRRVNPILLEKKMKEIDDVTAEMDALNSEKGEIETEFSLPDTYSNAERVKELNNRMTEISKALEERAEKLEILEDEYLEMSIDD